MAQFDLLMPKMGESVAEATIIKWVKNVGDSVKLDETILEIATDKVDSEIPSPFEGTLVKQLFKEGDVVQVGALSAVISSDASAAVETPKTAAPVTAKVEAAVVSTPVATNHAAVSNDFSQSDKFYSPLVKSIAKQEGIAVAELEAINGSGKDGRVTKSDILAYIPNKGKHNIAVVEPVKEVVAQVQTSAPVSTPQVHKSNVKSMAGDEIIEMDRMRKLIADHMVMSKHVSPHVTSFVEADVTNMVLWRDKIKSQFEKREGEKITFTP